MIFEKHVVIRCPPHFHENGQYFDCGKPSTVIYIDPIRDDWDSIFLNYFGYGYNIDVMEFHRICKFMEAL